MWRKRQNEKVTNEVLELEIPSFEVNRFPSMVKPHSNLFAATIKSNIVAFGDNRKTFRFLDESFLFIEIYSGKTKTWKHQYVQIDKRICYCVGSFMSKLYLIGGWFIISNKYLSSCYSYDINKTNEIK